MQVHEELAARSLSNPELLAWARKRVGHDVPPWDFEALAAAAWFYSPVLDVARAQVATAEAAGITAAQHPVPTLSVPFEYTTNPKPDESPYTIGLGLDIAIELGDKRAHRIAQARELSAAAGYELGAAAWKVRSQLRGQLLALWDARTRLRLLEEDVQRDEALARFLAHRVEVGEAARPQLSQARAELAHDRTQAAAARAQELQAVAEAAGIIGVPVAEIADVALDLRVFAAPPQAPDGSRALDAALRNRADIQAALARYQASQAALQLAIAGQYPDIHLGPGFTYDAGARKIVFNLSGLPLPVFNSSKGPIAEARARREEAAAQVQQAVATATTQVEQAAASLRSAQAQLEAADAEVQAQAALVRAAAEALRLGEDDRVNLLRIENTAASAQLLRQDALVQLQRAGGALEDAVQRPIWDAVAERPARSAP